MIQALALLLGSQLAGEAVVRFLGLPVPGPVIGLVLLLGLLFVRPATANFLKPVTDVILKNLSLLFVPAAVGIIQHLGLLGEYGLQILLALTVSTIVAMAVSALVFVGLSRPMKRRGGAEKSAP